MEDYLSVSCDLGVTPVIIHLYPLIDTYSIITSHFGVPPWLWKPPFQFGDDLTVACFMVKLNRLNISKLDPGIASPVAKMAQKGRTSARARTITLWKKQTWTWHWCFNPCWIYLTYIHLELEHEITKTKIWKKIGQISENLSHRHGAWWISRWDGFPGLHWVREHWSTYV